MKSHYYLKVKQIMARRFKSVAQIGTYNEIVEEGKEADDILQLLSSLQQTNSQNEITIQNLQSQLVDLTTERDAANKKSHKLMKVVARHRAEYETELSQERQKFAAIRLKYNEEAQVLKLKVRKLAKRCMRNYAELKNIPDLENKLIGLESECERMESELKMNTAKGNAESTAVYEYRLAALQNKLDSANKSNTEITLALSSWKEEVEVLAHGLEEEVEALGQALEEAKSAEKSYLKELVHMATLKEKACRDTMEAYEACKILQVEIDLLRTQASEHNGSQNEYNSTSSDANENHNTTALQQPWRESRGLSLCYSPDRSSSISSLVFSLSTLNDYNYISDSSIIGDDDTSFEDSSIIGIDECSLFTVS